MAANLNSSKPLIWLHGSTEEDPLVGFREELMDIVKEHFNVITYKQLKEQGEPNIAITGAITNVHRAAWFSEQLPLMPNLKAAATYGAGVSHLDRDLMKRKGIKLSRTIGVTDAPAADMAMALLLSAARKVDKGMEIAMQKEPIEKYSDNDFGSDVTGATVGIIGMGGIGTLIAKRCQGFDMKILYHNRREAERSKGLEATYFAKLDEMLPLCDFLVISCPLTEETKGMIGEKRFKLMKKTSILVNIGRGEILDMYALARALKEGEIQRAALDVTYPEPLPRDHPLLNVNDVIITPHYGAAVFSARIKMMLKCVNSLKAVLLDLTDMPDEVEL